MPFCSIRQAEAKPLYRQALSIWEQQPGVTHPDIADPLNNLALLYWKQGKYAEAESLYRRALQIEEQQLGPEHPAVTTPLSNLASISREQGKYAEAESLYQQALNICKRLLGTEHPETAEVMHWQCMRKRLERTIPKHWRLASTLSPCSTSWGNMRKQPDLRRLRQSHEQRAAQPALCHCHKSPGSLVSFSESERRTIMTQPSTRIIVLGAGIAGLLFTLRLSGKIDRSSAQITLVDEADTFIVRPRLHEFATNQRIFSSPFSLILRKTPVQFVQGRVTSFDPRGHRVTVLDQHQQEQSQRQMMRLHHV